MSLDDVLSKRNEAVKNAGKSLQERAAELQKAIKGEGEKTNQVNSPQNEEQ